MISWYNGKQTQDIPAQPSQTYELGGDRIHECHEDSACSVPAKDTQNTCAYAGQAWRTVPPPPSQTYGPKGGRRWAHL